MMNTTMEAKMASGAVATREITTANGVMHRVMVRVMGEMLWNENHHMTATEQQWLVQPRRMQRVRQQFVAE
jgi:C4-type Zn-finger protein